MKIVPTLKPGLLIEVENMLDWTRLESIAVDASKSVQPLSEALSSRMEVDEDWQEYVMPDLESQFSEQLHFIQSTIRNERSKNSESGGIHITKENVDLWYGAINQARIAIEQEHGVSKFEREQKERIDDLPDTVRAAMLRYQLYTIIQSLLVEHVYSAA